MALPSRHISVVVARPASEVYAFIADPRNVPQWAPGLGSTVELVDGAWTAESPMGAITFDFVPTNPYGVADHDVTLPSGEVVTNPLRVLDNDGDAEVVFTLRQRAGVSEADLEADAASVESDLAGLKRLLEGR